MNFDQWLALAGVIVAALAVIGGFFYWRDAKKEAAMKSIRGELKESVNALRSELKESILSVRGEIRVATQRSAADHAALRQQMFDDHAAISSTVRDLARSIKDEYVHQREFDIAIRNLDGGLTEAKGEIGAAGVRIDRLMERRSPGADG